MKAGFWLVKNIDRFFPFIDTHFFQFSITAITKPSPDIFVYILNPLQAEYFHPDNIYCKHNDEADVAHQGFDWTNDSL